jgi:predicted DNA binding CopG/RHH family protein
MKKNKTRSADKIVEKSNSFKNLMPSLDKLAQKEDSIKVTLSLTKASVEYFKNEASKREVCYQVMIRNLIDEYVKHFSNQNEE